MAARADAWALIPHRLQCAGELKAQARSLARFNEAETHQEAAFL
jgi:hypothetical protein